MISIFLKQILCLKIVIDTQGSACYVNKVKVGPLLFHVYLSMTNSESYLTFKAVIIMMATKHWENPI